jgi:hypothetical protein
MPLVARNSRWLVIRLSSVRSIRIHWARTGMSSSMPSSFSTAIENASSLNSGAA